MAPTITLFINPCNYELQDGIKHDQFGLNTNHLQLMPQKRPDSLTFTGSPTKLTEIGC